MANTLRMKIKEIIEKIGKWSLIVIIILLIILVIFVVIDVSNQAFSKPIQKPEEIQYSKDSKDWIDDYGNGTKEVIMGEITQNKGYMEGGTEQYIDEKENLWTAFKLDGIYKGKIFALEYQDENNKTKMRINKDMNPNDGIIEGFMVAEIENVSEEIIWVYIFVDEDWKQQIGFTNIFFGMFYQYYKPFNFTEISKGIYMDKVMDDPARHIEDFAISAGGIMVGNVLPKDIINNSIENITSMRLS